MFARDYNNSIVKDMIKKTLGFIFLFLILTNSYSQTYRYWTRNFNDESALLAGAVVGGGIGPSAIYFNPAGISEARNSSLSINTSLLSFNFYNIDNAVGEDMDLYDGHLQVQPRFISYLMNPKKNQAFSFELSFLNTETFKQDYNIATNQYLDILTRLPGEERYFASFQFYNSYREDWIGLGGSWKIRPHFILGMSMFAVVKSLEYRYDLDILAYPVSDTVISAFGPIPFYSANFQEKEYLNFNDYRLLWKIGLMYKKERFSFGFVIRTPSVHVYADGKRMLHKQRMSNIMDPEENQFLPNYEIADYKEKKDVDVNFKDPLSLAAGFTLYSKDRRKALFTTVEYFFGIDPYSILANEVPMGDISGGINTVPSDIAWMTYTHGARPVLNAGMGYRLKIKEDFMMMGGFRTDFNYRKDMDFTDDPNLNIQKGLDLDVYHITYGVSVNVFGQDLMAGIQYSVGRKESQKQYINTSDPVEYNTVENAPLQGVRQNTMVEMINSISLYFGATFNFGAKKDSE
jgi:hypothetical protein